MFPNPIHAARLLRVFAVGVCAVMLHTAMTTASHASCGDWLADSSMAAEHDASAVPADSKNVPCRGIHCRRAPQSPLPQSPSRSLTMEEDRWCQNLEITIPASSPQISALTDGAVILPEGPRSRLERPPRG
ncbi:MAG: hypothetical protein WD065_10155 [Planctomycetaceae bacterium]